MLKKETSIVETVASRVNAGVIPCLVLIDRIADGHSLVEALGQKGVPSKLITGRTPRIEKETTADQLRASDPMLPVVVATSTWATGINIPSIRVMVLAGRVKAPITNVQGAGRGIRTADGKPACEIIVAKESAKKNAEVLDNLNKVGYNINNSDCNANPSNQTGFSISPPKSATVSVAELCLDCDSNPNNLINYTGLDIAIGFALFVLIFTAIIVGGL